MLFHLVVVDHTKHHFLTPKWLYVLYLLESAQDFLFYAVEFVNKIVYVNQQIVIIVNLFWRALNSNSVGSSLNC